MAARQAGWSELNAKRKREAEANRLRLYRGETAPTTTTPDVMSPGELNDYSRRIAESTGRWPTPDQALDAWRLDQGTQAPTTTAPIVAPQRGLVTPDILEMQGMPAGLMSGGPPTTNNSIDLVTEQNSVDDPEATLPHGLMMGPKGYPTHGKYSPVDVAKYLGAGETIDDIREWTASDAGLVSTEERRKQYKEDMNSIFTKATMLKVLGGLSGNDGEDMSKMFMQFAFEKMDKNKEFAGEDRLKKIRDKVYYREGPDGELIFDAPAFRKEGYERVFAVGGDAKDAEALFGHLQQKKQVTPTEDTTKAYWREVDGVIEVGVGTSKKAPDRKGGPPWIPGVPPREPSGAMSERARATARQQVLDGDHQGAMQTLMLHYGERRVDRFGQLINPTLDEAREHAERAYRVIVNPALYAKVPDTSVPSTTGSGGETREQVIARVTREHRNKSEGERANIIISELERLGLE